MGPAKSRFTSISTIPNGQITCSTTPKTFISTTYQKGMKIEIRIITHGPGLHMFREDTSPVKERVSNLAASQDGLSFYACSNTRERMEKAKGKTLTIMDEALMVSSGIAEIMELQIQGWNYIKP